LLAATPAASSPRSPAAPLASLAYLTVQLVHLIALPAGLLLTLLAVARLLLASLALFACCSFRSTHLLVSPDESLVMKRVQTSM